MSIIYFADLAKSRIFFYFGKKTFSESEKHLQWICWYRKGGEYVVPTPGLRIKNLREKKDWSQLELSKRIGINNSVLSRIEADKRPIEAELLAKFSEVFGVSADYILGMQPKTFNQKQMLSPEDQKIVDKFMKLSDRDKEILLGLMDRMNKN